MSSKSGCSGARSCVPFITLFTGHAVRYLVARRLEFGFIGCYYATYLVWRPLDDDLSLYISKPFLYNSSHPQATTLGALSWLQDLALKQLSEGNRHAPYWGESSSDRLGRTKGGGNLGVPEVEDGRQRGQRGPEGDGVREGFQRGNASGEGDAK